jgi:hypothetical protein
MQKAADTRKGWARLALALALCIGVTLATARGGDDRNETRAKNAPVAGEQRERPESPEASGSTARANDPAAEQAQNRRRLLWTLILRSVGAHPFGGLK